MTKALTSRQQEVLAYITSYSSVHQRPPTYVEIAGYFGFKSANAAKCHVKALEKKRLVKTVAHIARGIVLASA